MRSLTIRNVPDKVYEGIAKLAVINKRSLQQQALFFLESCHQLFGRKPNPLQEAMQIRSSLQNRALGDVVSDVKAERDR